MKIVFATLIIVASLIANATPEAQVSQERLNKSKDLYLSYEDEKEFDLYQLRVFKDIPKTELKKLLSAPDKNGIRKVYDFKKLKNYIERTEVEDIGGQLATTGRVQSLFEVRNVQDSWINNSSRKPNMSILYWQARLRYLEADDRNPPAAAFLKVGGSWYLIGDQVCRIEGQKPFVTSDLGHSSALFVTKQTWSVGIETNEICSIDFEFAGQNSVPTISGITHYGEID